MLHDKTLEALTFQKSWAEKKCAQIQAERNGGITFKVPDIVTL